MAAYLLLIPQANCWHNSKKKEGDRLLGRRGHRCCFLSRCTNRLLLFIVKELCSTGKLGGKGELQYRRVATRWRQTSTNELRNGPGGGSFSSLGSSRHCFPAPVSHPALQRGPESCPDSPPIFPLFFDQIRDACHLVLRSPQQTPMQAALSFRLCPD